MLVQCLSQLQSSDRRESRHNSGQQVHLCVCVCVCVCVCLCVYLVLAAACESHMGNNSPEWQLMMRRERANHNLLLRVADRLTWCVTVTPGECGVSLCVCVCVCAPCLGLNYTPRIMGNHWGCLTTASVSRRHNCTVGLFCCGWSDESCVAQFITCKPQSRRKRLKKKKKSRLNLDKIMILISLSGKIFSIFLIISICDSVGLLMKWTYLIKVCKATSY